MAEFGARSTAMEVVAGHDLSGRTALVTGGASGIGTETVRALASAGARVVVAVRDLERAEAVVAGLRTETGNPDIETRPLDLAAQSSVRKFVDGFEGPLHLLIANAGVMAAPRGATADGFELQFGTNHLGHFALVTGLLPALRAAAGTARSGAGDQAGARVVVLSSGAHGRSDVDLDDPNFERRPYDPWDAYGQSKTANVLFAVEFNARYAPEGITANAVHPGSILTNLQRYVSREDQRALGWFDADGTVNPAFKTPAQGASTSIWAAVAPELAGVGGQYLEDCHIAPAAEGRESAGYQPYARDPQRARRLWELSTELLAPH